MKTEKQISFYWSWWFFLPISFILVVIGGAIFTHFLSPNDDINVIEARMRGIIFIWIGIVGYWWFGILKKYKK